MGFQNKPPGRAGVNNNYPWGPHPRDLFWGFIANAEYYGLPVNFLRVVGKSYTMQEADAEEASTWTNTLSLKGSTYNTLVDMNVDEPRKKKPRSTPPTTKAPTPTWT